MAQKNKTKAKAPAAQGSDKKGESDGLLHGLLTVLLSILIVLVVFGGAFYYVLKNNIYGLGEQFRPGLERIPVIRQALPPLPETEDPYDPKHLTQKELLEKYNELRNVKKDLTAQLDSANRKLADLENEKAQWTGLKEEAETTRLQNEAELKQIQEQAEQLEKDKKELSRLIAEGDKQGFQKYFEKVDKETAAEMYQEIVTGNVANQELKNLAKPYEEMDPANAANILTELGGKDMSLLIDLLGVMKADVSAEILENMEPAFAADLMQQLADRKLGKKP